MVKHWRIRRNIRGIRFASGFDPGIELGHTLHYQKILSGYVRPGKRSQKVNEVVTEQCSIDSKPTTYEVEKSEDYGGIYIGDKTSQSVENGSELNTKNLKNTDEERNKIEVIPEALKKSNETDLNIQHNILSLESLTVLPNTATSEEIITNEFVSCFKDL